jgi:hypothetical protein
MLSRDDFERLVQQVPSHGTERHAQLLYGLVRWLNPATVVEVGACHGYTSCWLARALQDNREADPDRQERGLIVIDDYSLQPKAELAFWHNVGLTQVSDVVHVAKGNSREVEWPERVDFAYIDGDHSFEGCRFDVEKAIAQGARCIALHDTQSWWGPRRYVEEAFPEGWTEISVAFDQGFTVMMKRPEKPPAYFTEEKYPTGALNA